METERLLIFSLKGSNATLYYDKSAKKVYETSQLFFGEDFQALPISFKGLHANQKSIYGIYSKTDIDSFISDKQLSIKYTNIDKWKDELKNGEILLMLMESK